VLDMPFSLITRRSNIPGSRWPTSVRSLVLRRAGAGWLLVTSVLMYLAKVSEMVGICASEGTSGKKEHTANHATLPGLAYAHNRHIVPNDTLEHLWGKVEKLHGSEDVNEICGTPKLSWID
jgi:hypothetical protein